MVLYGKTHTRTSAFRHHQVRARGLLMDDAFLPQPTGLVPGRLQGILPAGDSRLPDPAHPLLPPGLQPAIHPEIAFPGL